MLSMASSRAVPIARELASPVSAGAVRVGVGVAGAAAAEGATGAGAAGGAGVAAVAAGAGVAGGAVDDDDVAGAGAGFGSLGYMRVSPLSMFDLVTVAD